MILQKFKRLTLDLRPPTQDVVTKRVEVVDRVFPDSEGVAKLTCDAMTAAFPEWRDDCLANALCKLIALTVKRRAEVASTAPQPTARWTRSSTCWRLERL